MACREALRGKKHPADKNGRPQLLEASPSQRDDEKERRGHVEDRHGHDPPDSNRRLLGKHDQGCRPRPRDRGEAHETEKQPARVAVECKRNYNQGRHGCDAAGCHRKRHAQDGWEAATMGVGPVMQCLAGGSSGVPVFVQSGPAWPPNG